MDAFVETVRSLAVVYGFKLLGSIAIFIVGRWLAHVLINGFKKLLEKAQVDQTLISFLGNVLYYLLFTVVIVIALGNLGIPTTSIVAILGAATLAVGLALQDSLGNLAAGVMIILLRPYRVGDFVEINGEDGFVSDIQIFHTTLTSRDNKTIFIPNSDVMSSNIVNYSKTEWVRVDLVYGIGYGDDLLQAKRILQEIVQAEARVATEPTPVVAVQELGNNSVNLAVRPYVKPKDMVPVSFAITEQVKLRFDAEGISIPFPQRDVHLFNAN